MTDSKKILLVEYANWDSLIEIPYLFTQAGCEVHAYSIKGSWLTKSNHVTKIVYAPTDPFLFVTELEHLIKHETYDWIVFGDDVAIRLASKYSETIPLLKNILPISNIQNRFILGSKAGFSLACTKYNILTPSYEIYTDEKTLTQKAEKVSFPLLLKVDESAGGSGVFRCNSLPEVTHHIHTLNESEKHNLVLQKYITGENIGVEAIYKNGILIMYSYAKITKTLTSEFGISCERIYYQCPEIEKTLEYIGASFSINGFCSMTFIRDKQKHYFVEADFRPQAWYRPARLAGIHFEKGIKEFFSPHPTLIPTIYPKENIPIIVTLFMRSLHWNITHKNYIGIFHLLINKNKVWQTIPLYEPKVILALICIKGNSLLRKIKKII